MKKTIIIAIALFLAIFAFAACKKPESKKEASVQQAQKEEVKQQPKEKAAVKIQQLSLDDQRGFKEVLDEESLNEKEALQDIKILLKGNHNSIKFYDDWDEEERIRKIKYTDDFCTVIGRLAHLKSKEGFNFLVDVMRKKVDYPKIRACAAGAVSWYGGLKNGKWHPDGKTKGAISVLKEIVNDKDPEVRLEAAGSLLSLGEGDLALPILAELAKAGIHQSTFALDKLFAPEEIVEEGRKRLVVSHTKLWDKRGKEILIKALKYSSDEVKAFAAVSLADIGIEKNLVEETAIKILERLKNKKQKDYKVEQIRYSDYRAGYHASIALEKIKSAKGVRVLKELIENNDDVLLRGQAKESLKTIMQSESL